MDPLNAFVAGPDGGPVIDMTIHGAWLDDLARSDPRLRRWRGDGIRSWWSGRVVDWLNFVDRALAACRDDDDRLRVRWLDEDLDAVLDRIP